MPIAFVIADAHGEDDLVLYSALDEKPKSVADPRDLARVRDIEERPGVVVLVDVWSEDWAALGWIRLLGKARLVGPDEEPTEHSRAVSLLRAKYVQYANNRLERRPMIRVQIERATSWFASP